MSEHDSDSDYSSQLDEEHSLASRICHNLATSKFDARGHDFLPENYMEELITEDAIRTELGLGTDSTRIVESQQNLVEWIHSEAKKVFAIAAYCSLGPTGMLASMEQFKRCNFNNESLPIDNLRNPNGRTLPRHFRSRDKIWNSQRLYTFWEHQWKFLVPVFDTKTYNYNLESECIFPFIWKDERPKQGAFGCVYKVRIHPAHQERQLKEVAIKEIRVERDIGQLNRSTDWLAQHVDHPGRVLDQIGTEKAWDQEARALNLINNLNHEHTIQCFAAIRRGDHRYFMFPWANGGSLRDFWEAISEQTPNADIIRQTVIQLRGLTEALQCLHSVEVKSPAQESDISTTNIPKVVVGDDLAIVDDGQSESIRHGDLKPENILRFFDDQVNTNHKTNLGILKLADMGLAKHHAVPTQDRQRATSTRWGTMQYEAPEAKAALEGQGRSRLYDIWSMGCIMLEFIIWILYGNRELINFHNQAMGETQGMQFYEIRDGGSGAEVHSVVRRWMDHIQNTDPECSQTSAINDLLELVKSKLLVVDLPPRTPSSLSGKRAPMLQLPDPGESKRNYRATAESCLESIDQIVSKLGNKQYLLTGKNRDNVRTPAAISSNFLSASSARRGHGSSLIRGQTLPENPANTRIDGTTKADYALPPHEGWEFHVDNAFAEKVLAQIGPEAMRPQSSNSVALCSRCENLNFWDGGFVIEDKRPDLQDRSNTCDFCRLLWGVCNTADGVKGPKVEFVRNESTLRLLGSHSFPVLSMFRSPECNPPTTIQMGFPELLKPGTDAFFQLIQLWLQDCDHSHIDCRGLGQDYMPTRLIDVGSSENSRLCLLETCKEKPKDSRYIALSHRWGDAAKHPPFKTLQKNLNSFLKEIPYDQLPATFKDAVKVTRALGIQYLWIDSICIIQGDDGDFSSEAKSMEDVFSCAYFVLAASRATSQHDGFLKDHPKREYITFQRGAEKPFYVCQHVDDFSRDVLEGSLNSRGWVLQERVLARRTVFFTETQTYFECGSGVRCESLAKMHNQMADFLGDPKFPNKAIQSTRGLKIRYFQNLYKQYSRLEFTHIQDRPFAIAGVESRLCKAYGVKGGYGIFDDGLGNGLFHRSLLWRRGEEEPAPGLSAISFPLEGRILVPSWSWMAYRGSIDYCDPPFEGADWEKNGISPPWTRGGVNNQTAETMHRDAGNELVAIARNYYPAGSSMGEVNLIYDTELTKSDGNSSKVRCVIVAKSKDGKTDKEKTHYVLIVMSTKLKGAAGDEIYKRVGAGHMLGKYIALDKPGKRIRIL